MKKTDFKKLIKITIITFIIGGLFSFLTVNGMDAFNELQKPFEVPPVIFPIVWTVLYLLMSISCYIISETDSLEKKSAIYLYWLQLVVNSLWTLIFFGFKAYLFSFIWEVLLTILVVLMIIRFIKIKKIAGYLNIFYLLWLFFAGYLNLSIYLLNR